MTIDEAQAKINSERFAEYLAWWKIESYGHDHLMWAKIAAAIGGGKVKDFLPNAHEEQSEEEIEAVVTAVLGGVSGGVHS